MRCRTALVATSRMLSARPPAAAFHFLQRHEFYHAPAFSRFTTAGAGVQVRRQTHVPYRIPPVRVRPRVCCSADSSRRRYGRQPIRARPAVPVMLEIGADMRQEQAPRRCGAAASRPVFSPPATRRCQERCAADNADGKRQHAPPPYGQASDADANRQRKCQPPVCSPIGARPPAARVPRLPSAQPARRAKRHEGRRWLIEKANRCIRRDGGAQKQACSGMVRRNTPAEVAVFVFLPPIARNASTPPYTHALSLLPACPQRVIRPSFQPVAMLHHRPEIPRRPSLREQA